LNLNYKSNQSAICQLFYDIGDGYTESHSEGKRVDFNQTGNLIFNLPTKKIYGLRFDPLDRNGSLEIKGISILGRKIDGDKHQILHEFELKSLKAVQEVHLAINDSENLIATTHHDCNDPIINIPLKNPLDHWKITDFLDTEWLKKSIFFALLITPITLSLGLSETKENEIMGKIEFQIKNQKHTLRVGETYRVKPENCYQDTSEENIRSLIEEIKKGTHWKQAVKKKFKESNPWLYEIITSPKRTKFIDDFVKPTNSSILDIGAGWGQFSLPLAKQNQICSLEPTPERLDFIKAAAKQEGFDQNISYIGADYFDIKFENKFDLILSIGVLEWVGAFKTDKTPEIIQEEFLSKIKNELSEDGKLVVGIENRLGLKYLLGANDDHTGLSHISYFQKELAKTKFKQKTNNELLCLTYSLKEYEDLLLGAGFQKINFFATLPDYKLIEKIFPIAHSNLKCSLNDFILGGSLIKEHDGTNGKKLEKHKELVSIYYSLAEMNISHFFAPSFYIIAS
jgi:2-polyprenyl-3-methyl-5-hydroxy-6-metoxy-1,4-benzoquinol methylase